MPGRGLPIPRRPGHLISEPRCDVCSEPASLVELVPPGDVPAAWLVWSHSERVEYERFHDPTSWRFRFEGIDSGNGHGDDISAAQAAQLAAAFSEPLSYEKVRQADLFDDAGFCRKCERPYCATHWNVGTGGYGTCPHGHGRRLDPHRSPTS